MHELYRVTKYYNKPELHPSFRVKCYSVMHFNLKGETVTFMILSGGGVYWPDADAMRSSGLRHELNFVMYIFST